MKRLFLVSEVPAGYGQQVVHSICQQFQPILALCNDFEKVDTLVKNYPEVTWVVVDITRSREWLGDFLRAIPAPNYIINFSGSEFQNATLPALRGCDYEERERGKNELTFFGGLVKPKDDVNVRVFINVVEKRSEVEKKSRGFTKAVNKLVKGASKAVSDLVDNSDDDDDDEQAPLLHTQNQDERRGTSNPDVVGCIRSLLSCCLPCIFGPPEMQYSFQTPEELKNFLRTEQTKEIQTSLRKLHDKLQREFGSALADLRKREDQQLEDLTQRLMNQKEEQQKKLAGVSEKQNKNTRDNLSNTLGEETLRRIEESRSRQNKGKVDCDTDKAFRDGKQAIRTQVAGERQQIVNEHYSRYLEKQLKRVEEIQTKYENKLRTMSERCFGRVC